MAAIFDYVQELGEKVPGGELGNPSVTCGKRARWQLARASAMQRLGPEEDLECNPPDTFH